MEKLIICVGQVAKRPLELPTTKQGFYSLEELCYYLHENLYVLEESIFQGALISWLQENGEEKLAGKLQRMQEEEASVSDRVAAVWSATDYYTENEITNRLILLQQLDHMSQEKRRKMRGDNYLEHGKYVMAIREYLALLQPKEEGAPEGAERGNIHHNLGIAYLYTDTFSRAAEEFRRAYELNQNPQSKLAYEEAEALAAGQSKKEEMPPALPESQEERTKEEWKVLAKVWEEEYRK